VAPGVGKINLLVKEKELECFPYLLLHGKLKEEEGEA
jgi:hypothetical protein